MIVATHCPPEEVRAMLAAVVTPKIDPEGTIDVDAVFNDAVCIKMEEGGRIVGAYVLVAKGGTLWVRLAAGRASVDLSLVMGELVERQGREFDAIGFQTRRRGLIKKALALDYRVTGQEKGFTQMRKNLR